MPPSRGPGRPRKATNALARWIDAKRLSRDEVADRLGVSRAHLDRLCADGRRPDLELAFAIQDLTGGEIPARSWLRVPTHSGDE